MQVEQVMVEKLIPYANNSRTHSQAQIAQIAASIREFGFNNPILIDEESTIIAGHGRALAAALLELETAPCIRLDHLSENQRKAFVIADNKIALSAGWDEELLKLELEGLTDAEQFATGFSMDELDALFHSDDKDDSHGDASPMDENRNLLLIECITEIELEKLFDEMKERGFQCKIMN